MSFIESVKGALPDYAKDTKLNLDAVLLRVHWTLMLLWAVLWPHWLQLATVKFYQ